MNKKIIIIGLFSILISGCTYIRYLPSSYNIVINQYGSYIKLFRTNAPTIAGELIAVDSVKILVLERSTENCLAVPIAEVNRFKLQYAQRKHYGWTIPVYTLSTIAHGMLLVATAPLNLAVTVAITISSESAFTYRNRNMTFEKLRMFARFPQGIPTDVDMASIKY